MKKVVVFGIIGCILFHGVTVRAEAPLTSIRVITAEWEGYTHQDGTGLYFEVLKAVYEPEGITVEFELLPWKRAQQTVKERGDALVGGYEGEDPALLYPTWHIDIDEVTVIYKKDTIKEWQGVSSLEDKTLGWIRGYGFEQNIPVPMKYYEFDKVKDGLLMLVTDRLDAVLDYIEDIGPAVVEINQTTRYTIDLADYRMEQLRTGTKLHAAFVNSARGKKLMEIFEARMAQLFASGQLDAIYRKYTEFRGYDEYPQ